MKKYLSIASSAGTFLLATPVIYAQEKIKICPDDTNFSALCKLATGGVGNIIEKAVVFLFIIAVIIALFYLIWGGIKWILSGGDKGGVEAARATIIAAILGLIVTLASFFILTFVLKFFGVDLFSLTLPSIK
ncbi:MAG: hypothetical protein KBD46_00560 [Candidatus Levybacteria bacterium]|nr:hypothetical protein [Candidatus Levybacteria bacterium]